MNNKESKASSIIKKFTKNLNEEYREKNRLQVVGRDKEIKEVINVLSRLIKNNPLLIGHPGVGKTSVVEGLVQQIEKKDVPWYFFEKNIYQLEIMSLMAGTKFQGDLEERLKIILDYMSRPENNAILFIDEFHAIVSYNRSSGGLDITNLLKPMLARGEIQCIAATTYREYYQWIEKDGALNRRFSNIYISEPTEIETLKILTGVKPYFENYYKLKITDEALETAIDFSSRYLTNRYFPDKAIDLLDETCARVKSEMWYKPEIIENFQKNLNDLEIKKLFLVEQNDLTSLLVVEEDIEENKNKLSEILEQDKKERENIEQINLLQEELSKLESALKDSQQKQDFVVASQIKYEVIPNLQEKIRKTEEVVQKNVLRNYFVKKGQVAYTFAKKFSLNVHKLLMDEQKKMLTLLPVLQQRIKGQKEALCIITDAIFRAWAEVQDPKKPLSSFLFVGPTGVGKTEVAITISEQLLNSEKGFWRFDMTEFSEAHSVSKFIGSPPGYIGFEETSLFESLSERMSNVILFDEIEKCHPEIINLFLQMLDNGFLKLSNGKEINFRNSVIIFTSNLSSEIYFEYEKREEIEEQVKISLRKFFRPEFLNRLSEVIIFNALNEETLREVIIKELNLFIQRIEENKRIKLNYVPDLVEKIFREAGSREDGARPIKHYIEKKIGTLIAKNAIFNVIKPGGIYLIDLIEKTQEIKLSILSFLEEVKLLNGEKKKIKN